MQNVGVMRTFPIVVAAVTLLSTGAFATDVSVNAAAARKPIAPSIYNGVFGDEMHQAQLSAAYSINLPNGELARVALLGVFGQASVTGVFSEAPMPPAQGAAVELYTNYDGEGGRFGDTSIETATTNPMLSAFAAFDLDAKVTVVLVNKSDTVSDATKLDFKGIGQKGNWRAFELTTDGRIAAAGSGTIYDAVLTRTVRPYTALLIEYRPVGGILPIRTPPPAEVVPLAEVVQPDDQSPPAGCSASGPGLISLAMIVLVGLVRRRAQP